LSEDAAPGPIRLALGIEDPALADRLAALLAGVPGLRLVGATEAADAAVVPFTAVSASAEGDFPLTQVDCSAAISLCAVASLSTIDRGVAIGMT
jgi:hypothetical protein